MRRIFLPIVLTLLASIASTVHIFGVSLAQENRLDVLDVRATTGAAPGYLGDAVCQRCHADIYGSYQDVGMAKSFRRAGNATDIEAFGEEFFHQPSQRYYRIIKHGEELTFSRYQKDADGNSINELELPVSWIMGSGNRARSYIHQSEWGEMFLLPVSWYTETGSWDMSPGFEAPGHDGIGRNIQRECMFCHNAYPEVESGTDFPYSPDLFPSDLPEGTGCQRCHGPGAAHVNSVLNGESASEIRDRIVNPAKLPAERRDDVCFQCHMLPSFVVTGIRKFQRGIYSYRPGESLSDYMVSVEASEQGVPESDRFEINHHGYRLYQSSCFQESNGALACISCHDPHQKKASDELRAEAARVCVDCHADPRGRHEASTAFDDHECVTCHMPTRRTRDVIKVTMTDHRISTGPFDLDSLVEPTEPELAPLIDVRVMPFPDPPADVEAETYALIATLRANRSIETTRDRLEDVLREMPIEGAPPMMEFATASLATGDFDDAEQAALSLVDSGEYLPAAYKALGVALMAQNLRQDAVDALKESLRLQPDPEVHFNLAAAYIRYNQPQLAEKELLAAIELRPTMSVAWKYLGLIYQGTGRIAEARRALVRAIELEPRDMQAYSDLINLLRASGDDQEANRYIELGRRISQLLAQ